MQQKATENHSVLLIITGGTISMGENLENKSLTPLDSKKVISSIPELNLLDVKISSYSLTPLIDSSNMSPERWIKICEIIKENYDEFDGFVVLHGTDTMSFSASAISFMLENLSKPVIFTGSQLPVGVLRSDARENLLTAIEIAETKKSNGEAMIQEVCLFFEGQLFRGNRTTKRNAEQFDAFASFNYPLLARSGVHIKYFTEYCHYQSSSSSWVPLSLTPPFSSSPSQLYSLPSFSSPSLLSSPSFFSSPASSSLSSSSVSSLGPSSLSILYSSSQTVTSTSSSSHLSSSLVLPLAFSSASQVPLSLSSLSSPSQVTAPLASSSSSSSSSQVPLSSSSSSSTSSSSSSSTTTTHKPLIIHTKLDTNITILKLFPGISQKAIKSILATEDLRAVVIECFGAGNAPSCDWLCDYFTKANEAGIILLDISQCRAGSVELGHYEVSLNLQKAGVISGYDMTTEAAVTKLMFLLGHYSDNRQIKENLMISLRGEMTII